MSEQDHFRNDWNRLADACRQGEIAAHLAVDLAAQMPSPPTVGPITREMLGAWAGCKGRLSGGTFRFRDGCGFSIRGNRNEPFLSCVCGPEPLSQLVVLLDLDEYEPVRAGAVFDRIRELAMIAEEELPNIGRMAMPAMGKQMHQAMCTFMIRLGEIAKEAGDSHPSRALRP